MSSSNDITPPSPILIVDSYPSAPTITSSKTHISICSSTLEYNIKENDNSIEYTEIELDNTIIYYYQEPPLSSLQPELNEEQNVLLLYNQAKEPIWKLTNRDWHGMTLIYHHLIIVLSTTPPQFRFTFNKQFYHWQVVKESLHDYSLKCYVTDTKQLIAQFDKSKLLLNSIYTNPFKQSEDDDPFTTLVLLSGLLVNNHIKALLKSLGNSHDALQLIIDPQRKQQQQIEDEEYDEIASLSSAYPRNYPGHQSLVDERGSRWSSADSFKSIELDPGVWHCWWGYKFWWSWFPCCMPGGCCDRVCIRFKRHKSKSKQGWQQQHY
ncbi:hypothetical protein BDF21DRAFT_497006 [Thamnidium elegans]|uniref:Uncharacterized protein n=1 Tax=Thamnidium elegans TaxID=101142 RepID=A0A8H7SK08_9FUNG|nr:hypothetical protein INT48_008910 [Thamnidium elegans]KAI8063121.1 hypothetical protein BDF21DRAFT_497006 [Thamnidium elegans]